MLTTNAADYAIKDYWSNPSKVKQVQAACRDPDLLATGLAELEKAVTAPLKMRFKVSVRLADAGHVERGS